MRRKTVIAMMMALSFGVMQTAYVTAEETSEDTTAQISEQQAEETVQITLSDNEILVDGEAAGTDESAAVYIGADIIYYESGQESTYGAGDENDAHSEEEAAAHTVITITQPGTYRVSGTLSAGQIVIDLGEDAENDENAAVDLILDNADITCTVASAIVVYNAYECGSDDTETASIDVDTTSAGFNLILAEGSSNTVNGSYVAKIYKEGTTQEQIDADEAKKAYKFDAAIDSLVSFNIDAEGDGSGQLIVNAENEGIETSMHLTINGGNITVNSADDAINANEDGISVLTINDGTVTCYSGLGTEGDGMDSNGWIVINGGYVTAYANSNSQDSGVDSDMGIYLNGGTVLASGNMYDEIASDSEQTFLVLSFGETVESGQWLVLRNADGEAVTAFTTENSYQTLVYTSEVLTEGDYTLYSAEDVEGAITANICSEISDVTGEVQLQYSSNAVMGNPGGGFGGMHGGEMPQMPNGDENGEMPENMTEGEMPEGMTEGEFPQMPEGDENREIPERPEGTDSGEMPERPNGKNEGPGNDIGQMPQGGETAETVEPQSIFSVSAGSNSFSQITKIDTAESVEETVS